MAIRPSDVHLRSHIPTPQTEDPAELEALDPEAPEKGRDAERGPKQKPSSSSTSSGCSGSSGCWSLGAQRAGPFLVAFWVVPATGAVGVACAATTICILAVLLGRWLKCLNSGRTSTIVCFAVSCWFFVLFWPSFLAAASWNNKWIPGFRVIEPGYRPEGCDTGKLVQELLEGDFLVDYDAVHWDAAAQRCDCRLPDQGAQGGRCQAQHSDALPRFTLVTALVVGGRTDRSGCAYLRMFAPQMHMHTDMVFYGEAWALEVVQAVRAGLGLVNRTRLRLLEAPWRPGGGPRPTEAQGKWGPPTELALYHLMGKMQAVGARKYFWHMLHGFKGGLGGKVVPNYAWATNEKGNFVTQAAREDYFKNAPHNAGAGPGYFVWVDAGAGHGNIKLTKHFCACNLAVPGTVTLFHQLKSEEELFEGSHKKEKNSKYLPLKQLTESNYLSTYDYTHHFDDIMGTFWGGDLAGLELFWGQWNATFHRLLEAGSMDHEQPTFCLIAAGRPSWLRYISSDYFGVLHLC